MKMIKSVGVLLGALLCLQTALAQDLVSGKWNMNVQTPNGPMEIAFNLKADGMNLSGSMSNAMMGDIPISEGMAHGNEVTFKVVMQAPPGAPGGGMTMNFKGVIEGQNMQLTSEMEGAPAGAGPGGPQTMTATKAP